MVRRTSRRWKTLAVCLVLCGTTAAAGAADGGWRRVRKKGRVVIHAYPTFGTWGSVFVHGRVLRGSRLIRPPKPGDRAVRNLLRGLRRFLTRDRAVRGGRIVVEVAGRTVKTRTDRRGMFRARLDLSGLPTTRRAVKAFGLRTVRRLEYVVRLSCPTGRSPRFCIPARGRGWIHLPGGREGVSVISDIDDTLIETSVTRKARMVSRVLLHNYHQIRAFPGAARFLRSLLVAPSGHGGGTMHFVSGSPINLFPRLQGLLRLRSFPRGSLDLRRLGLSRPGKLADSRTYKLARIGRILRTYPDRRFVLVGDAGEKDPEVYRKIRSLFPGRIVAIYIKRVEGRSKPAGRFAGMVLFSSYGAALADARKRGLFRQSTTRPVRGGR